MQSGGKRGGMNDRRVVDLPDYDEDIPLSPVASLKHTSDRIKRELKDKTPKQEVKEKGSKDR